MEENTIIGLRKVNGNKFSPIILLLEVMNMTIGNKKERNITKISWNKTTLEKENMIIGDTTTSNGTENHPSMVKKEDIIAIWLG